MQDKGKIIKKTISFILTIVILIVGYILYEKYNFNDYIKAEYKVGNSRFERDSNVRYSKYNSYKIESNDFNDAMFYERVEVTPNTPYRVTCKIKTEKVETKNSNTDAGAHICIADSIEKSNNVTGTTDWTEVTFYFNSKNRTQLDIGFRLGGFEDEAKGKAWFSDIKIESGISDESNTWNFLCLLFDNVDVNINKDNNNQNIKLALTQTDKDDIKVCMQRFKNSIEEMSLGKIKAEYDIEEISNAITKMSYDDENGYYVSGYDIKEVLDRYLEKGKYDHIFIAFRTGDINQRNAIPVNDWIGLGSIEYRGVGLSNIRLPDDDTNYIYKYDVRINTFPEEVLLHEFLHTLEKNAEEYGYQRPDLHSNNDYGYQNQKLVGLKSWYQDYMNKTIKTNSGNVGLPTEIYNKKPAKSSDFGYARTLDYFKEPENILEEMHNLVERVKKMIEIKNTNTNINTNAAVERN